MILLLTGCSESKKLSTNQSEDNNQIKYKSKDITINENLLKENIKKISSNVRNYGSDGEIESSEYINNQLTLYFLPPHSICIFLLSICSYYSYTFR